MSINSRYFFLKQFEIIPLNSRYFIKTFTKFSLKIIEILLKNFRNDTNKLKKFFPAIFQLFTILFKMINKF